MIAPVKAQHGTGFRCHIGRAFPSVIVPEARAEAQGPGPRASLFRRPATGHGLVADLPTSPGSFAPFSRSVLMFPARQGRSEPFRQFRTAFEGDRRAYNES